MTELLADLRLRAFRGRFAWLVTVVLTACFLSTSLMGCGYSEEEMQAKLRQIDGLKEQLAAEEANNKKVQRELDDANARVEQLKNQLAAAGVNVANLKKDMEEQARALEEYKKRAAQLEAIKKRFELCAPSFKA